MFLEEIVTSYRFLDARLQPLVRFCTQFQESEISLFSLQSNRTEVLTCAKTVANLIYSVHT